MADQEVDNTRVAREGATLITLKIHAEVEVADLTMGKGVITKNIQNNKFTTMTDQDRTAHQNRLEQENRERILIRTNKFTIMTDQDRTAHQNRPEQENRERILIRTVNTNRALSRSLVSIIINRLPNCMRIVELFRAKTFS